MSRSSVAKYAAYLEKLGVIRRTQQKDPLTGEYTVTHYELVPLQVSTTTANQVAQPENTPDPGQDTASDKRRHSFFIIDNSVIDDYDLCPEEGWLYVIIVRFVNHKTGIAFPSLRTLQRLSGMSRHSVIKYLRSLVAKGLIICTQQRRPETNEFTSNHYELVDLRPSVETEAPVSGQELDSANDGLGVVRELHHPSANDELGVVRELHHPSANDGLGVVRELHHVVQPADYNNTYLKRDTSEPDDSTRQSEPDRSKREREDLRPDAQSEQRVTAVATSAPPSPIQVLSQSEENSWNAFCELLANICKLDYALAKSKVQATARKLWQKGQGYSIADLRQFEVYWLKEDWRGKKGDKPSLNEVLLTIRKAVESGQTNKDDPHRLAQGYEDIIQS